MALSAGDGILPRVSLSTTTGTIFQLLLGGLPVAVSHLRSRPETLPARLSSVIIARLQTFAVGPQPIQHVFASFAPDGRILMAEAAAAAAQPLAGGGRALPARPLPALPPPPAGGRQPEAGKHGRQEVGKHLASIDGSQLYFSGQETPELVLAKIDAAVV